MPQGQRTVTLYINKQTNASYCNVHRSPLISLSAASLFPRHRTQRTTPALLSWSCRIQKHNPISVGERNLLSIATIRLPK
ncbi:hypothetical protein P8452_58530 [Trifolium repens]|nr:hypothetical protein P8452_58530 [Trifolium repens]